MADLHHFNVNGTMFQIPRRYECESALGGGAFGVVCSASDNERGGAMVAIKKLGKAFHDEYAAKKLVRELRLLKHFAGHEAIVGLLDILEPTSTTYDDVYVVTDLMDCDLKYCLKHKAKDLEADHYQYFLSQLLNGVHAMHSASVLHRDLKPENIFVKADCTLKIGDLGLARDSTDTDMSQYVVTRWYRAPELIMNWNKYGYSIDIWSVGCIFAEMISVNHKPLFPGVNPKQQLDLILKVLGTPSAEDIAFVTSETSRKYVQRHHIEREDLKKIGYLPHDTTDHALDFLYQALQFNPEKRPTAMQLKQHPYIFDDEEEEEEEEGEEEDVPVFSADFTKYNNTVEESRQIVNVMIKHFHPNFSGPSHPHVTSDTCAVNDPDVPMFNVNDEDQMVC